MKYHPFDSILRTGLSTAGYPDKMLTCTVDSRWWFAVNGNAEPRYVDAPHWGKVGVPGFHAAIFYDGWLAGIASPRGCLFMAGRGANAEIFDQAITDWLNKETE